MNIRSLSLWTILWITLTSTQALAWGELGHRIIAESGSSMADPAALTNCHVTVAALIDHTNDPDQVWRNQRWKHPKEGQIHYFHVDKQPSDWRTRTSAQDLKQGGLVYRIADWIEEAKKLRKDQKWEELSEHLYGLSHYVGDLVQPLHLHHDYDGDSAGLPGLHSQFETKMLNRFESETRSGVKQRLGKEKVPATWPGVGLKDLIFDTAQQSFAKATRLFDGAKPALHLPSESSRKKKKNKSRPASPRFVKKELWQGTGGLAMDQLAIGSRLWAHTLNTICK